jgi:CheY-like chemotaxis protein
MWRVLVIDDDLKVLFLVKKILGSSGITVLEAHNGAEGLSLAFKQAPDLILCDMMMPVMDGMQFLREWAANEAISHIPVIMVTAASEKNRIIEAIKLGATDYVVKPFDPLGLRSKVSKVLERLTARQHAPQGVAAAIPRREQPLVIVASEADEVRRRVIETLRGTYEVVEVEDGAECLHKTAARRPDVVLLSRQMPLIPSDKVAKNIKGADETRATRLVLLATPEEIEALDEAFRALLASTVKLPVEPEALRAAVDGLLDRVGFFVFDRGDLVFLRFLPGGLAAAAGDLDAFAARVRSELLRTFDPERQRLVVDLRFIAANEAAHVEPAKHLLDQAGLAGIKVRFRSPDPEVTAALQAAGVPSGDIIPDEPQGGAVPTQPTASAASRQNSV